VSERDAGVASSLVNTGQQVCGSIGLAILGTVAWTVVASTARHSAAVAQATAARAAAAGHAIHPTATQIAAFKKAVTDHSLAVGFSRGFEVSAGVMVLALVITLLVIRVTKKDLEGIQPPMMG
jgi:hypothetical protein